MSGRFLHRQVSKAVQEVSRLSEHEAQEGGRSSEDFLSYHPFPAWSVSPDSEERDLRDYVPPA